MPISYEIDDMFNDMIFDDFIEEQFGTGVKLITNFDLPKLPIYIKALSLFGSDDLFINDAYVGSTNFRKDNRLYGLYCKKRYADLTGFWMIVRGLENSIIKEDQCT